MKGAGFEWLANALMGMTVLCFLWFELLDELGEACFTCSTALLHFNIFVRFSSL